MNGKYGFVTCGGCQDTRDYAHRDIKMSPGNGQCLRCGGDGVDPSGNEESNCRRCSGTGICPCCNGSGVIRE